MRIGRKAIRSTFGRLVVPGWPIQVKDLDAIDLLALPEDDVETDPIRIRAALRPFLFLEPEQRPYWIPAKEPWPPSMR
jgi:hypothetical protein